MEFPENMFHKFCDIDNLEELVKDTDSLSFSVLLLEKYCRIVFDL